MVQVEDAPGSRPHRGLQEADVVYEYLTEGGISRFTVLYWNSSGGFRIEPVRSARLVTLRLVQAYGGVLFYSGASDHVQAQIGASRMYSLSESSNGGRCFTRDPARPAPHNLYTTGDQLHQCLSRIPSKKWSLRNQPSRKRTRWFSRPKSKLVPIANYRKQRGTQSRNCSPA